MDEHVSGGQEGWAHETQCEVIGRIILCRWQGTTDKE